MGNNHPKRILVLEDSEEMRAFLVDILTSRGYQVTAPVDSYVALSIARGEQPYDLVTVDVKMSLIDGLTFVKALQDTGIDTPVIAITADPSDPKIEQMRRLGVRHILPKPFKVDVLFETVRDVLGEPAEIDSE